MSRINERAQMAQCKVCGSDLQVIAPQPKRYQNAERLWFQRSDRCNGEVYCSNFDCRYYNRPLKLGKELSRPVVA